MEVVSQSPYTMTCGGPKLRHFDDRNLYVASWVLVGICRQARLETDIKEQAPAKGN
jgi:hypothetical protein